MRFLVIAAFLAVAQARPGLFYNQPFSPLGIQYASLNSAVHPHHAVELNAASEAMLPRELLKSRFVAEEHYSYVAWADLWALPMRVGCCLKKINILLTHYHLKQQIS